MLARMSGCPGRLAMGRAWAVLFCVVASTVACSDDDERSVENFCSTYQEEKEKFQDTYSAIDTSDPSGDAVVANLLLGIQSLGDVSIVLEHLEEVAPPDIEPDVEAVAESWEDMRDIMGEEAANALNPSGLMGAALKGVLMSLEAQGSWTRLGDYITEHCDA